MGLRSAIGPTLRDGFARVVALFEVLEQPELHRLPAQALAGQRARGPDVDRSEEGAQPAEVLARILTGDRLHRQVELPADRLPRRPAAARPPPRPRGTRTLRDPAP